jgi:ribulose-phosphate 3-epimerase
VQQESLSGVTDSTTGHDFTTLDQSSLDVYPACVVTWLGYGGWACFYMVVSGFTECDGGAEMKTIVPSLFAADVMNLKNECDLLYESGFRILHVDMMDGHFVPHIAFGPEQVKRIKEQTDMTLDVHMMVSLPENKIDAVLDTGAEMISVHVESTPHVRYVIDQIKAGGRKVGVAINPGTDTSALRPLIHIVDYVLIMSINPGRPHQTFIHETFYRVKEVRELIGERDIEIEVDGGIDDVAAKTCFDMGASMVIIGNYLFSNYQASLEKLRTQVE